MLKSKLTPFVRKQLCNCIELGMPIGRAAVAVGISHQTFNRWRSRGEEADPSEGGRFIQLVEELARAEANFIKKNIARIDMGANKNTEDAKWLLERRDPAEFGKRVELEVGLSPVLLALRESAKRAVDTVTVAELQEHNEV